MTSVHHPRISVLTDPAIGGRFVSWSLYYLAGYDRYWFYRTSQEEILPDNPLTNINAHNFRANQIISWADVSVFKDSLPTAGAGPHVFYMHRWGHQPHESPDSLAVSWLKNMTQKCILMSVPPEHHFYHHGVRQRVLGTKFTEHTKFSLSWEEMHEDWLLRCFGEDLRHWQDLGLVNIWDRREFLALNLRPYDCINKITDVITSPDCDTWYLDARDAWFMLDQSIGHIFNWLNMTIVAHRWPLWLDVYNQWRRFHYQRTRFFWYFPQIIKAIVQGHDIDLRRLELDLVQESIIQHELIYKHGLNLKTFGLEKFSNTNQLHHLLESNKHQVGPVANTDIDSIQKNNQENV